MERMERGEAGAPGAEDYTSDQYTNLQRVKVYRLNDSGHWDDKGTGHVSCEYMEQSDSVGLVVVSEEDQQPLLVHRISRDDIYQRQGGDTIITWTDPDINTDIALSFQEAVGCNYIWEQIKSVQQTYAKAADMDIKGGDLPGRIRRGAVDEYEFGSAPGDGFYQDSGRTGPSELPPAELGSLPELVKVVADCSPFAREKIASLVLKKGYLRQLLDLFKTCEDLEDRDGLHMMYRLVRGLVLLNDASLFDELLQDANVMDVVGALEYDPDMDLAGGGGGVEAGGDVGGGGGGGGEAEGGAEGGATPGGGGGGDDEAAPGTTAGASGDDGEEGGAAEGKRASGDDGGGASTGSDAGAGAGGGDGGGGGGGSSSGGASGGYGGGGAEAGVQNGGEDDDAGGAGAQQTVQHRAFLRDSVVFKEVVPIQDAAIRAKIHQTYRIGYLKDVILPRVLDDATFGTLTSIMLFNNVEVVLALQNDPTFLKELFARLRSTPRTDPDWDDLVGFLQELCSLAKHLQVQQRGHLFASLVQHGLFYVLTDVLQTDSETSQLKGADVLMSTLHNDPSALRAFLVKQEQNALFSRIVQLFVEGEEGLQAQLFELLKLMLDPETMDQPVEKSGLLELFYDAYVDRLVASVSAGVRDEPPPPAGGAGVGVVERGGGGGTSSVTVPAWTLVKTIELLCFCVQHHSFRIKYYVLRNNVVEKVLNLTHRKEKYLVVAAVRFLRACVGLKDEFYNRYIIKNSLFAPVMKAFEANGSRYNLLNSAVLELVDFIRRENIKNLVVHLVEEYEPVFAQVDYVDTFRLLVSRYQQGQEPPGGVPPPGGVGGAEGAGGAPGGMPGGLMGAEGGANGSGGYYNGNVQSAFSRQAAAAQQALAAARRRRDGSMSKSEEDYFNSEDDDDEDDGGGAGAVAAAAAGGDKEPPGPSLRGAPNLPPLSARFVPMRSAFSPPADYEDGEGGGRAAGVSGGEEGAAAGGGIGAGGAKRSHEEGVAAGDLGKRPRYSENEDDDKKEEEGLTAAQRNAALGLTKNPPDGGGVEAARAGGGDASAPQVRKPTSKPTGSWVSVVDDEKAE